MQSMYTNYKTKVSKTYLKDELCYNTFPLVYATVFILKSEQTTEM